MKKIKTYLPIFPGFYGTNFDSEHAEEDELYNINENRELKGLPDVGWDELEFNYKEYRERVSEACVGAIESELKSNLMNDIKLKYEELISPRFYNFSNDSVNIEVELSDETINEIVEILSLNEETFKEHIKGRYTSCDGFISHHSNNHKDWINALKNGDNLNHKLGAILEFLLDLEGYDEMCLMDGVYSEMYICVSNYDELIEG